MNEDGVLLIKHRWEPAPFYDVWMRMGFEHVAVRHDETEWHIRASGGFAVNRGR